MSSRFKAVDRETPYLLPMSIENWLPEQHLARFVVDVVSKLDLHELKMPYSGGGSEAFNPEMLLALLFYGYATGVFSSRKLEAATYDSLAFRYIAANSHPDHDTINAFRKRFLKQMKPLFLQILTLAQEMGILKLGRISLDGSKVKANASKHSAMSWGHAVKLEAQLKAEVERLMELAANAESEIPEGMNLPEELARREQRLAAIAEAKAKIEARAAERHAAEQAEYEQNKAKRETDRAGGKPPKGPEPGPPAPGVRDSDQVNLTDEESRIMPTEGGKNFQQAYNVQAGVDTATMLVLIEHVTPHTNDKREIEPALKALAELPEKLGKVNELLADTGYRSDRNTKVCEAANITPYIAGGRQSHHPPVEQRFCEPPPLVSGASAVEAMDHRLATVAGRAIYAERKSTVEPVFGIAKSVLGFRQFHLRGLEGVSGEWTLVTMAWNLKRLFNLTAKLKKPVATCSKNSNSGANSSISITRSAATAQNGRLTARIWTFFTLLHARPAAHLALCPFFGLSPTGC